MPHAINIKQHILKKVQSRQGVLPRQPITERTAAYAMSNPEVRQRLGGFVVCWKLAQVFSRDLLLRKWPDSSDAPRLASHVFRSRIVSQRLACVRERVDASGVWDCFSPKTSAIQTAISWCAYCRLLGTFFAAPRRHPTAPSCWWSVH